MTFNDYFDDFGIAGRRLQRPIIMLLDKYKGEVTNANQRFSFYNYPIDRVFSPYLFLANIFDRIEEENDNVINTLKKYFPSLINPEDKFTMTLHRNTFHNFEKNLLEGTPNAAQPEAFGFAEAIKDDYINHKSGIDDCMSFHYLEIFSIHFLFDKDFPYKSTEKVDEEKEKIPNKYVQQVVKYKGLMDELNSKILGQKTAVRKIVERIYSSDVNYKKTQECPRVFLFFTGPSGVGKSFAAKALAQYYFNTEGRKSLRINMAAYEHHSDNMALIGDDSGYSQSKEGMLTGFIRKNPNGVVILEELEKAHTAVIRTLNDILCEGKVRDSYTLASVDFSDSIIIITSNAGCMGFSDYRGQDISSLPDQKILEIVRQARKNEDNGHDVPAIPPEMLSRFSQGGIIAFNYLNEKTLFEIVRDGLLTGKKKMKDSIGVRQEYDIDKLSAILLYTMGGENDARKMREVSENFASKYYFDSFTECDRHIENPEIETFRIKIKKDALLDKLLSNLKNTDNYEYISDDEINYKAIAESLNFIKRKGKLLDFKTSIKVNYKSVSVTLYDFFLTEAFSENAKKYFVKDSEKAETLFSDVIGNDDAKQHLKSFVSFVKNPRGYAQTGHDIPKGLILYGPPGTGKTLLSKALANEADCPFIETSGTDFLCGRRNLSEVFRFAREYSPSVLFIDEIDAIGLDRRIAGEHSAAVLDELLHQMDGFSEHKDKPVFVIAATNRFDMLDSALKRRFSNAIETDFPSGEEIFEFLHTKKLKLMNKELNFNLIMDYELREFAEFCDGTSLAQIDNFINSAFDSALIEKKPVTKQLLFEKAEDRIFGKKTIVRPQSLESAAIHETGHAWLSYKYDKAEKEIHGENYHSPFSPTYVTLQARENILGFVRKDVKALKEYGCHTKEDMKKEINITLAGRAATEVVLGDEGVDSGNVGDLKQATSMAFDMVSKLGMYEGFSSGLLFDDVSKAPFSDKYYEKVNDIMKERTEEVKEEMEAAKPVIIEFSKILLQRKKMSEKEIYDCFDELSSRYSIAV